MPPRGVCVLQSIPNLMAFKDRHFIATVAGSGLADGSFMCTTPDWGALSETGGGNCAVKAPHANMAVMFCPAREGAGAGKWTFMDDLRQGMWTTGGGGRCQQCR